MFKLINEYLHILCYLLSFIYMYNTDILHTYIHTCTLSKYIQTFLLLLEDVKFLPRPVCFCFLSALNEMLALCMHLVVSETVLITRKVNLIE